MLWKSYVFDESCAQTAALNLRKKSGSLMEGKIQKTDGRIATNWRAERWLSKVDWVTASLEQCLILRSHSSFSMYLEVR